MKGMVWTLENGRELRIESDGDEVTIRVPGAQVDVRLLEQFETFVSFGAEIIEEGARLVLGVKEEECT